MNQARLYKQEQSDVIMMSELEEGEMGVIVDDNCYGKGFIVIRVNCDCGRSQFFQILGKPNFYSIGNIKVRRLKKGELIEV